MWVILIHRRAVEAEVEAEVDEDNRTSMEGEEDPLLEGEVSPVEGCLEEEGYTYNRWLEWPLVERWLLLLLLRLWPVLSVGSTMFRSVTSVDSPVISDPIVLCALLHQRME